MIAENLRTIRAALGMTQTEFGKVAGVAAVSSVSAWESGEAKPRTAALLKISEYTNIPKDVICGQTLTISDVEKYIAGDLPDGPTIRFDAVNLFNLNNDAEIQTLTNACKRLTPDDILALVNMARHLDHVRYKSIDDLVDEK